jgi:hypothetical protein
MVSGCVGFLRDFALTFGPSPTRTVRFVRKVSRIFQVVDPTRACCREVDDAESASLLASPPYSAGVVETFWRRSPAANHEPATSGACGLQGHVDRI